MAEETNDKIIRQSRRSQKIKTVQKTTLPKKMGGGLFYLALLLTALEDFLDLFSLGSLSFITSIIISLLLMLYFLIEGVSFRSFRKVALWVTSLIIELIPFVSIFPTYTVSLLITKKIENDKIEKKAAQKPKTIIRQRKRG